MSEILDINPISGRLDVINVLRHQGTVTPSGTTQTVDFNAGESITIDLNSATGDVTLTLSNAKEGASYLIKAIQGATSRDLIWPASVKWDICGGTPVVPTTEDYELIVSLYYDGAKFYGGFREYDDS